MRSTPYHCCVMPNSSRHTSRPTLLFGAFDRHNFGDLSADGKTIYYASNKRDPKFFDIYRMDIASGKALIAQLQAAIREAERTGFNE